MKKVFTILCLFFTLALSAQGSFQVINLGNAYRIKATSIPNNAGFTVAITSKQLRVSVTCLQSMQTEVTFMPTNGHVDYELNGNNLISVATIFYNGTTKVGTKCMQPKCIVGLNPINQCFKKI